MTEAEWDESTDPTVLLEFLTRNGTASPRKLGLFAVACCRNVLFLLTRDYVSWCPEAIDVHERYAEGLATEEELRAAKGRANADSVDAAAAIAHPGEADYYAVLYAADVAKAVDPVEVARDAARAVGYDAVTRVGDSRVAAIAAVWERDGFLGRGRWDADESTVTNSPAYLAAHASERTRQADLLRCIFGNTARPLPLLLAKDGGLIRRLAQATYDDRIMPKGTLDPARLAVLADAVEESGLAVPGLLEHLRDPGPHFRGCHALDALLGRS